MNGEIEAGLAHAYRTIGKSSTVEETLLSIVEEAVRSIPGFDHAGVSTIDKQGTIKTRAVTSDLVRELDAVQYGLREGPCYDSLQDASIVVAPQIRHDQRWPRYVPQAVEKGLRSQLAVKLYLDDEGTVGGLNLYSTTHDEIEDQAPIAADLFASYAVVALEKTRELDTLHQGLASRETIGKALGLLMAKHDMNSSAAFDFMLRTSSHSNIKVRDVAEEVIQSHEDGLHSRR